MMYAIKNPAKWWYKTKPEYVQLEGPGLRVLVQANLF